MTAHKVRNCVWLFILIGAPLTAWCQKTSSFALQDAQSMLQQFASDVKKHYYDPKFHGLDWDSKVGETKQKIDQADTPNRALSEIAALLDSLNDSHTFFLPPQPTAYSHDYGWRAELIGDTCYVTHVHPGSDAEAKGVKPGDELIGINGYATTKKNFLKVEYFFNRLRPQPSLRLVLRDASGKERTTDVAASVTERDDFIKDRMHSLGGRDASNAAREQDQVLRIIHPKMVEMGDDLMILQLRAFVLSDREIDSIIGKARKHKTLIVDLREDGGGNVDVLKQLLGRMFANSVKIGDRVGKEEHGSIDAKGYGNHFDGKLIVLVDSESASASELFARVIQIQKRGVVIGDVSSGRVMESMFYPYQPRPNVLSSYGAFITVADIIMTDGKSLERVGVTPDEVLLPAAADLAAGRDPVLAHPAETLGVKLTPEDAGKMFPYEWPPL